MRLSEWLHLPDHPIRAAVILVSLLIAIACSPQVGSDKWCEEMKNTHKADWSTNDAAAFTKHCVFK